ncbi:3'-5' exoribonuclease YhaM family protein [Lapidilactobacillus achengensis]|uniref:3'-5' exoribonuclease YhaM family protein n=1 Tax=Lapidilactobacillus achengensis TaxID=2486000 RepID=A0ABW1UQE0_9LACO|nr:OB-fold nucleic acid binding domain-containing protein [Lapidilactobacillus achengensis]
MTVHLSDLKTGEAFNIVVLIKQADVRIAKNGKRFISLTFQDRTGDISGMLWDAHDEDIAQFSSGQIVHLTGQRDVYNGQPQVKITGVHLAKASEGFQVGQFTTQAPLSAEQMATEINQEVFNIDNAKWNRIVRFLLQKHQAAFYQHPAAKSNHHDFAGGLAFHTLSMMRLAKQISQQYTQINYALLLSGVLLHDLGKTIELSGPVGTEYTLPGNLIGHIVLIDEEIVLACAALKIDPADEDVMLLRHVVLAHHGLLEYGSPERPKLLEAEVLHSIDEMDASINMITKALTKTAPGEFSERIFGLDNRRFYRPKSQAEIHL